MRIGIAGHCFQGFAPEELLELLSNRWCVSALDYWPWNGGDLDVEEYVYLAEKHGVEIFVVNLPSSVGRLCDPGSEAAARRELLNSIDLARELGAPFVQFYTGVPARPDFYNTVKLLCAQLAPIVEKAEHAAVTLVIENNLDQRGEDTYRLNPSRSPELLLATIEALGSSRLKVCYDPCNFYTVGIEGFPYAYDLLRPHVVNVHVKDCRRFVKVWHEDLPYAEHLLIDSSEGAFLPTDVGLGAVNWRGILERLGKDGYEGWLTLDPFTVPEKAVEWCDRSLAFMKEVIAEGAGLERGPDGGDARL